jgi:hypothetical protein
MRTGVHMLGLGGPVGMHSHHKHANSIMDSTEVLTKEHIDPRNHQLVSGLKNDFNEILADASYNYSKSDSFLPYRVKDYPAPTNPGDLGEFLIQGEWVITPFMGDWYRHEALKYSARRKGLIHYGTDSTSMWEERIHEYEQRTGTHVVVCSWDGTLSKNNQVRRKCEHELSKVLSLWVAIKGPNCCRFAHNRKWAPIAAAYRARKPLN